MSSQSVSTGISSSDCVTFNSTEGAMDIENIPESGFVAEGVCKPISNNLSNNDPNSPTPFTLTLGSLKTEEPEPTQGLDFNEKIWTLHDFQQLFQAFTAKNQLDEVKLMVNGMQKQIQLLTDQVGQLVHLKAPAHSKEEQNIDSGENNLVSVNRTPQTPRKVSPFSQQLLRQDLSPVDDSLLNSKNDPTALTSLKRSLAFPSSLEELLDKRDDKIGSYRKVNFHDVATQTDDSSPVETVSMLQIKQEIEMNEDSLRNESYESKTSLLMLADIALANPEKKLVADEVFPDSGRSSDSNCSESPTCSFKNDYKDGKGMYRIVKRDNARDTKIKILLPKAVDSQSQSADDSSEKASVSDKAAKPIIRKRRKDKKPLPCDYCGKLFNNQSSLRQHESFHRPVRPFKCEHEKCDKAYKTRSELNRHLVVHSGEKKHLCKLCGKRFLRKQYLKTHLLRHHETGITMVTPSSTQLPSGATAVPSSYVNQIEPLTYRCQLCMKIFVNDDDLSRHMRSYHEKKRSGNYSALNQQSVHSENQMETSSSSDSDEHNEESTPVEIKTPTYKMKLVSPDSD